MSSAAAAPAQVSPVKAVAAAKAPATARPTTAPAVRTSSGNEPVADGCSVCRKKVYAMELVELDGVKYHKA